MNSEMVVRTSHDLRADNEIEAARRKAGPGGAPGTWSFKQYNTHTHIFTNIYMYMNVFLYVYDPIYVCLNGCFYKLGVLITRALLFGVCMKVYDFWKIFSLSLSPSLLKDYQYHVEAYLRYVIYCNNIKNLGP